MKTLNDIKFLSESHPVIGFCLEQVEAGAVDEKEALIEMVLHLAQNLRKTEDDLRTALLISQNPIPSIPFELPIHDAILTFDEPAAPEKKTPFLVKEPLIEAPAAEPKIETEASERIKKLDTGWDIEPRAKKKRGWPW